MREKNLSKLVSRFILLITVITFVLIVILFFLGDYSLSLLFEDTFFVVLMIVSIILLPKLEQKFDLELPIALTVQIYIFLFSLFMIGNVYNVIALTLWFDKVLHFMSGMFVTHIGILFAHKWLPEKDVKVMAYIGLMYSLSASLLWEIIEFLGDIFMSIVFPNYTLRLQTFHITESIWILPQPYGLADTMIDVCLGALGALIFVLYYRSKKQTIDK